MKIVRDPNIKVYRKNGEITGQPLWSVDRVTWQPSEKEAIDVYYRKQQGAIDVEHSSTKRK